MNTCGLCDYMSTISKPVEMSAQKKREGIGRCRANRYGNWLHHSTAACDKFVPAENAGARVKWMQHTQEDTNGRE